MEQIAWELANKESPLKDFTDSVQDPELVSPSRPRYEQPLEKTIKKKGSKRWLLWTTILVAAGVILAQLNLGGEKAAHD